METLPAELREPSPARRVLIVDDNEDARLLLAGLLAAHGYEVESAGEADDALQIAARFRPQVVVLDIGLPGIDGWELARRLRGISGLEQIRLVALTGYGSERDRERSRDAGIDAHLLKPIEVSMLTRAFA